METIIGDEIMVWVSAALKEKGFSKDTEHINEIAEQITALIWELI